MHLQIYSTGFTWWSAWA